MPETTITLPEGMSKDDFMKAFQTFQKARISTKIRDTAVRKAMKTLIENHKPEYDKLVAANMPKG